MDIGWEVNLLLRKFLELHLCFHFSCGASIWSTVYTARLILLRVKLLIKKHLPFNSYKRQKIKYEFTLSKSIFSNFFKTTFLIFPLHKKCTKHASEQVSVNFVCFLLIRHRSISSCLKTYFLLMCLRCLFFAYEPEDVFEKVFVEL